MAVLVATVDGYHILTSSGEHRVALEGHRVSALSPGPAGSWIAVVDGHEIRRHGDDGEWTPLAASDLELESLVTVNDVVYAGTVGPRVLRLEPGGLVPVPGFDAAPGRDEWHPVGSPLTVRSFTATAGGVLLASVHVGGILRSADAGGTWDPTIEVDADVHEVRAHPVAPDVVMAAAAVGLCVSRDAGRSWQVVVDGLHATYARAVAFDGDDVLVSASEGPFTRRSAIYRLAVGANALQREGNGLPEWLEGNVDTRCIGTSKGRCALADGSGAVWVNTGDGWDRAAGGLPFVTGVVVV